MPEQLRQALKNPKVEPITLEAASNERSVEELLAEVPPVFRGRLIRTKTVLHELAEGRLEAEQEERSLGRVVALNDAIEVLQDYLRLRSVVKTVDYPYANRYWGQEKYPPLKPGQVGWRFIPYDRFKRWFGQDIDQPEVRRQFQEQYYAAIQAELAYGSALVQILGHLLLDETAEQTIERLRNLGKIELRKFEASEPPPMIADFSPLLQTDLLANVSNIELNEGCSVRCIFCAFDAPMGVRRTMPFKQVLWLISRVKSDILLYHATDPLDYMFEIDGQECTYAEIVAAYSILHSSPPYTSTAYPVNTAGILRKIMPQVSRISLSDMNIRRLKRDGFVGRTAGGTLIPIDSDLALRFLGESQPMNNQAEMAAFREEEILRFSGRHRIGLHAEGHAKREEVEDSIACRDGVIASPKYLNNSVRMMTTDAYPRGVVEVMITPNNLGNGWQAASSLIDEVYSGTRKAKIDELLKCVIIKRNNIPSMPPLPEWKKAPANNDLVFGRSVSFYTYQETAQGPKRFKGQCRFNCANGIILSLSAEEMPA